jgi:phage terminase large subunit GpA-like protein
LLDNAVALIRRARAAGLRPDTQLLVSEWADAHRRLPKKSSAEPGPWRTDRTPYLREIMDCMSSTSEVEEVVLMKAAQVGGSEAILNTLGYVVDHSPGPVILVQPTVDLAKRFSRQRVEPLVSDTPRLTDKVAPARSRDSGNTLLSKDFPGGQVIFTGANSAVGLRSMPAQVALMDEIDGYPVDVDEEGSPIDLVEARQRTFARKKRMKVSTPTIAGRSAIETAYDATDQRRYYVPCPACGEMQPLEFSRLSWERLGLEPDDAVYECRACSHPIQDHQKAQMLAAGEWRMEAPEHADPKIRGYHLNALYSPVGWMSWGDIASKFVKTHKNPEQFRVFVNTVLGEVWTAKGEAPDWEYLQKRRETYAIGSVPMGALFLTCGCDVQKDRIVYEVVGWGRGKRSWSIDYGEFPGNTDDIDRGPYGQVEELLARTFHHEADVEMPIRMLAIDSGYNSQIVYEWARKHPMNRVIAVKGQEHGVALVGSPTAVEINVRGRKRKRGGRVWPVCSSMAKSELYGWLKLEIGADGEEPSGFCHFPMYGDEYFRQLTAEQIVAVKSRRGYVKLGWEIIAGRQNHVLDARVYARCAAYLAGLDRMNDSDWVAREELIGIAPRRAAPPVVNQPPHADVSAESHPPTAAPPVPAPRGRWITPRRGGWLTGGR